MTPLDQAIEDWKASMDKLAKVLGDEIATQQKDREELLLAYKNLAEQRIAQANGEAAAIRIQAEAIQQQGGAAYIQLKWIERWDGKQPMYMLGGATPLISIPPLK